MPAGMVASREPARVVGWHSSSRRRRAVRGAKRRGYALQREAMNLARSLTVLSSAAPNRGLFLTK